MKYNTILVTNNYELFKKQTGNRELKKIRALEKTLKCYDNVNSDYPFFSPIIVNEKMEVIDGQHRLNICMEYDFQIEYIIRPNLTINDTMLMNKINNTWSVNDIIESYVIRNVSIFPDLKKLAIKHDLDIKVLLAILDARYVDRNYLIDIGNIHPEHETGYLEIINTYAPLVKDVLNIYKTRNVKSCNARMLKSLMLLFKTEGYDHNIFMKQLNKYSHMVKLSTVLKDNIEILEEVYNYRRKGKNFRIEY